MIIFCNYGRGCRCQNKLMSSTIGYCLADTEKIGYIAMQIAHSCLNETPFFTTTEI